MVRCARQNLILFVGDSMRLATVAAARILDGQRKGGPGEDAVRGSVEQNAIFHFMVQATPKPREKLCAANLFHGCSASRSMKQHEQHALCWG